MNYHDKHFYIYKGKNKSNIGKTMCNECKLEIDVDNEWSHSSCYKTQSEIEEHYTLSNFPNKKTRYGPGAGSISPYPKTDGRSKAYYDK